jgi:hypothetical protein
MFYLATLTTVWVNSLMRKANTLMSNETPNLSLPFILPSQAQKHVTHNEAIERLDALVQLSLEGVTATSPPTAPSEGQAWALGATPTGDWAGQGGMIASWRGGGWLFVAPQDGWMGWCKDASDLKVHTNGAWQTLASVSP